MDKDYTIQNSIKSGEFESKFGTMVKYTIEADGESGELSQKPTTPPPKAGDKIFGHFEDTAYGKRFKKASQGNMGGFRGQENPQRQISIEWQSARRDAVDYCIAKSTLLFNLKKIKEAEEELSGKHIFEVALYFKGIETGATQLERKKELPAELPERQIDDMSTMSKEEINDAGDEVDISQLGDQVPF